MTAARASQLPAEGPECIPLPRDADATYKNLCISCRLGVFLAYVQVVGCILLRLTSGMP